MKTRPWKPPPLCSPVSGRNPCSLFLPQSLVFSLPSSLSPSYLSAVHTQVGIHALSFSPVSRFLSPFLPLSILFAPPSLSLSLCLSVSVPVSVSLPVCLCPCLCLSACLSLSLSLSLSVSLFPMYDGGGSMCVLCVC